MNILIAPNPILSKAAEIVTDIPSAIKLGLEMLLLLEKHGNCVGLAAPQVGESIRLFVASKDGTAKNGSIFINPEITTFGQLIEKEEGCLSIPGEVFKVKRPEHVSIKFINQDGREINRTVGGKLSRIYQHEYDHLVGKLISEGNVKCG